MDTVWLIRFNDGNSTHDVRFRAHCRECAQRRFERQNRGCHVTAVVPAN